MPRFIYRRVLFLLLQLLSTCTSALMWKLVWVLMADVTRDIGYNNRYSNGRKPSSVTVLLSEEGIFRDKRNNGGGYFPLLNGLQMLLNDIDQLYFLFYLILSYTIGEWKDTKQLSLSAFVRIHMTGGIWHTQHFAPFITDKHLPSQNLLGFLPFCNTFLEAKQCHRFFPFSLPSPLSLSLAVCVCLCVPVVNNLRMSSGPGKKCEFPTPWTAGRGYKENAKRQTITTNMNVCDDLL